MGRGARLKPRDARADAIAMSRPVFLLPLLVGAVVLIPSAPALAAVNCSSFPTQAAAQAYYNAQAGDPDGLDRDGDGWACESNPAPMAAAPKGAAAPVVSTPTPTAAPTPTVTPTLTPTATPTVAAAKKTSARATSVVDGDTIKVRTATGRRLTVRLIGIDTPETKKPSTPVECGGKQASAAMRKLIVTRTGGRRVTLTSDPSQDSTDRFGRTLAYVNLAGDGTDVGRAMIARGWATLYVFADPFARLASFTSAQNGARAGHQGAWSVCGGKFHRAA